MIPWLIQFLNQHALLLLGGGIVVVFALVLLLRRARRRWWGAWAVVCLALGSGFFYLRTPAATLYSPPTQTEWVEYTPEEALAGPEALGVGDLFGHEASTLESVEAIQGLIAASGGKPTLVDVYADYGFG